MFLAQSKVHGSCPAPLMNKCLINGSWTNIQVKTEPSQVCTGTDLTMSVTFIGSRTCWSSVVWVFAERIKNRRFLGRLGIFSIETIWQRLAQDINRHRMWFRRYGRGRRPWNAFFRLLWRHQFIGPRSFISDRRRVLTLILILFSLREFRVVWLVCTCLLYTSDAADE